MIQNQDRMFRRIMMSVVGVLICGVGVGLFKFAAFGVDPFQSLMGGLAAVIPVSFGLLYIIVNAILLLFSVIFDRSKIGIATFINLFLLGYVVDFTHQAMLAALPGASMGVRIAVLAVALPILSFSCSMYFVANLGVSTYDAMALVFNQKCPGIPFKFWRVMTDFICVGLGVGLFLLSGKPMSDIGVVAGVGTIITAFCMGPFIEFFNVHVSEPILNR